MKSGMFQDVSAMNEAFGNPKGDPELLKLSAVPVLTGDGVPPFDKEAADNLWARLDRQCKNIASEYYELLVGLEERDLYKVRDALCDINVFSLGAHHFMGLDADADMAAVVESLFSRFCVNQQHLDATSNHYFGKGVAHVYEGEFPRKCLKSSCDQGLSIVDGKEVWEYPKGKFLKALGYHQPVFK